jgi:hypothetical protein
LALIDNSMVLNFRDWLEVRHHAAVKPDVKKWIDSADKLKQTVEKLKDFLKKKSAEKPAPEKKVEIEPTKKPERPEIKPEEKPEEKKEGKPERPRKPQDKERPEIKDKIEKEPRKPEPKFDPKIIQRPTRLEKERLNNKGSNRNGREPDRPDFS